MNVVITSAIIAAAALVGYVSYIVWGPENKVEEACEQVIKTESGESVELSPSSTGPSQPAPTIQSGSTAEEIADEALIAASTAIEAAKVQAINLNIQPTTSK